MSGDFIHHSSSPIPILRLGWLIWNCAEWRHLGWSGMSSYCAVVLPSPILEGVFHLERTEEPWHSQKQKPRGTQDRHPSCWAPMAQRGTMWICQPGSQKFLAGLSSWGRAHAGIANPAPGCSDSSHGANRSISACHFWGLLTVVTSWDEPIHTHCVH